MPESKRKLRKRSGQKSTDGKPVVCSASCCPKHPRYNSGSRMAVPVDCRVEHPGKLGVCRESEGT